MKLSKLLAVVLMLQILILLTQWFGGHGTVSTAQAQVPEADATAQRLEIIDELKANNAKLDQIAAVLSSGNLQVHVTNPDYSIQK
jgi:cell division protein FtsB